MIRQSRFVLAMSVCAMLLACSSEGASITTMTSSTVPSTSTDAQSTVPASPTASDSMNAVRWGQEMLDVVAGNAYYADRVDFHALQIEVTQRATARGPKSVYHVAYEAVAELNDRHSDFWEEPDLTRIDRRANAPTPSAVPHVTALAHRVGLIKLPSVVVAMASPAADAYIAPARDGLQEVNACGWILDLRSNGGGSVGPMLEAVAPLLGPGAFLAYRKRTGGEYVFTIDSGLHLTQALTEPTTASPVPGSGSPTTLAISPVAVLIGAETASSAEGVLMAFIGRPDTMSFGQPTRGVPTGNTLFRLSDGSGLNLTTAIGVDRNGHTYEGPIRPDETIEKSNVIPDPVIAAATSWLANQPACATATSKP